MVHGLLWKLVNLCTALLAKLSDKPSARRVYENEWVIKGGLRLSLLFWINHGKDNDVHFKLKLLFCLNSIVIQGYFYLSKLYCLLICPSRVSLCLSLICKASLWVLCQPCSISEQSCPFLVSILTQPCLDFCPNFILFLSQSCPNPVPMPLSDFLSVSVHSSCLSVLSRSCFISSLVLSQLYPNFVSFLPQSCLKLSQFCISLIIFLPHSYHNLVSVMTLITNPGFFGSSQSNNCLIFISVLSQTVSVWSPSFLFLSQSNLNLVTFLTQFRLSLISID